MYQIDPWLSPSWRALAELAAVGLMAATVIGGMSGGEWAALITALVVPVGAVLKAVRAFYREQVRKEYERGRADRYREEAEETIRRKNVETEELRAELETLRAAAIATRKESQQ